MGKVDFMDTIYGIYMPFGKSLLKGSIGASAERSEIGMRRFEFVY